MWLYSHRGRYILTSSGRLVFELPYKYLTTSGISASTHKSSMFCWRPPKKTSMSISLTSGTFHWNDPRAFIGKCRILMYRYIRIYTIMVMLDISLCLGRCCKSVCVPSSEGEQTLVDEGLNRNGFNQNTMLQHKVYNII